ACCGSARRESLRAGRTGSLFNNGKSAAPAAAANLFAQAEPAVFLNNGKPAVPVAAANRFALAGPAAF
ncbi:hypothetical protein, partial [Ruthenibacterium lactatiformans]|uniref:hypothetical protein n=1 Tax=Ruthenibacterium lactatiformans TaxID=1550024 RepID=UPI001967BF3A